MSNGLYYWAEFTRVGDAYPHRSMGFRAADDEAARDTVMTLVTEEAGHGGVPSTWTLTQGKRVVR